MLTETQAAALRRLRRKIEILRLDLRAKGSTQAHDAAEMLALVKIIEEDAE